MGGSSRETLEGTVVADSRSRTAARGRSGRQQTGGGAAAAPAAGNGQGAAGSAVLTPAEAAEVRASRPGGLGSSRLADSLSGLLAQVNDEVTRANQLAAEATQAAAQLAELLDAYTGTVQTLSQLYHAAPDGPLAQFWAESLRPDGPRGVPELIAAANRAARIRVV
jgi:hypothetical protein